MTRLLSALSLLALLACTLVPSAVAASATDLRPSPAVDPVSAAGDKIVDLEVEKTVDMSASDIANRKVVYQVLVRNSNDAQDRAWEVKVKDHLPAFSTVLAVDTPSGASFNQSSKTWTIDWMDPGEEVILGITVRLSSKKVGSLNCASVVSAQGTDIDSTPGNFSGTPQEDDESCAEVSRKVDLELTKTVSDPNPRRGDTVTYTITLTNSGDAEVTAHDITVQELFPAGFEILALNPSKGSVNATNLNWNVSSLEVGESATLEVTVKADPAESGSDLVVNGLYRLHDHPDGSAKDPTYGLRLDKLFENYTPITFSFDRGDSEVWMQVSGSTITIYGRVFGGEDGGSDYTPGWSGYWDLHFTFDGTVSPVAGDDDLKATLGSSDSHGFITPLFSTSSFRAGEPFDLAGYMSSGAAFFLGNEANDQGHRGFNGLSGWGWLEHGRNGNLNHVASSDWLFTADPTHPNAYRNCVQIWEAEESDLDSAYGNGFTVGEDDDACAKVHIEDQQIDLALLKEAIGYDSDTREAEYRVTVYNQSTVDGTGIVVRDYLPADAVFTRVISTTQGSAVALSDTEVEWTVGTVAGGATDTQDQFTGPSASIVFRARIGPSLSTANIAEIFAADQIDIDSTPGNFFAVAGKSSGVMVDEDDNDDDDVPIVDLSLQKKVISFDSSTMLAEYELTVANNSQVIATDVVVRDLLPFDAVTELGSRTDLLDVPGPVNAFDWNVGNIAPGETRTTTVQVKIGTSLIAKNCAEIHSLGDDARGRAIFDADSTPGNFDVVAGPQEDDEACVDKTLIDLALQKTVNSYDPTTQQATYLVTVLNEGFAPATGVIIRDFLPAGAFLTGTPSTTQGAFNGQDWTVGTLPINGLAELRFSAKVGASGETRNCAEVYAANEMDFDSEPSNLTDLTPAEDDEACARMPLIDLRLEKKALDPTTVNLGQNATFLLTVTNDGPDDAVGVMVKDQLPAGLSVVSTSPSQGTFTSGTATWFVGDLAVGQSATLTLAAETSKEGTLTNCAEVKQAAPVDRDSTPGNFNGSPREDDEACAQIWVADPRIDLKLKKSANPTTAKVGDTVTFKIEVENQSDIEATGVMVSDLLPSTLEIVATRPAANAGSAAWTFPSIPGKSGVVIEIDVRVKSAGEHTNCAEVKRADQKDADSTPGNFSGSPKEDDEACSPIWTTAPKIDLKLVKTVDKNQVLVGDFVTYTLTVTNETATAASGVQVIDYLPNGLALSSATPSAGSVSGTTWDLGFLAGNTSATLKLKVEAKKAGEFKNCAEIWDAAPQDTDSTPGNFNAGAREDDDSCVSIWVGDPKIDLRLEKTVNKSNASVGGTVTWTLSVFNDGAGSASGVVVADYLPSGLTVTSTRPAQGYLNGLTWTVGSLAPNASTKLEIDTKVNAAGEFTNCAEVWDADQQDADSRPGNFNRSKAPAEDDEACVSIWTNDPRVDLRLSKTVSKTNVNVGDVVTYAIVVNNDGPADASGVVVADYLPSGLVITASRANKGAFSNGSWNLGFLAVGQTARLELDAKVNRAGEFTNCAEVWDASPADKDSAPGNFSVSPREDDEACVSIWSREVTGTNEITGYVFVDQNGNLLFDAGDYGQGGATVQLWRDLNGNTEVDGSDQFVDDVVTAADGSYGFWINETGALALQVDASTIPPGANLLGGNSEDANFIGYGKVDAGNNFPLMFNTPPVSDAMCFLVADNDGAGYDSPDVLTKLAPDASYEQVIGSTYTDHIESIAFNPWTGVLYAADDRRLGTLNTSTGVFTEIGEFGGGEGEAGWRPFLDIDGLAFDPLSGELFASVRKVGEPDFLIKVNPATGSFIPFSSGLDYLVIKSSYGLNDIDDIAIDPVDGTIWAINNEDGEQSRLVKIDRNSGVVLDVKALPIGNVEGLGFFGDGTLYGTGGEGLESIVVIDKATLSVNVLLTIGANGNRDYEAVDCLTNATNSLSVSVFNDRDGDGWMASGDAGLAGIQVELFRDVNGNGMADFADRLVAVGTTGGNGTARFETAANGAFVTRVADSALPLGSRVTSKSAKPSWFGGFGESAQSGLVGISMPASSATSTSVEDEPLAAELPTAFALKAAYPNPFNPQTTVPFDLTESVDVRLAVYDLLGRQVALLVDGQMSAGSHQARFDAGALPSGTYLVRLSAGQQVGVRTVTLIK